MSTSVTFPVSRSFLLHKHIDSGLASIFLLETRLNPGASKFTVSSVLSKEIPIGFFFIKNELASEILWDPWAQVVQP